MTNQMKVLEPLDQAVQRIKELLFRPFSFATWLRFGFIIFLSAFLSNGCSAGYRWHGTEDQNWQDGIEEFLRLAQKPLVLIAMIAGFILAIVISVIFLYLQSRGNMMLVRAAALNRPLIGENWRSVKRLADSLFLFRLAVMALSLAINGTLVVIMVLMLMPLFRAADESLFVYFLTVWPLVLALLFFAVTFWTILMLLHDFVVPFMYQFDELVLPAWRRFFHIAGMNIWPLFLFYLIRGAYNLLMGGAMLVVGCLTCCIGFIPYISHTLFAPFFLFDRLYSMYAVSSLGPEYEMIVPEAILAPTPPISPISSNPPIASNPPEEPPPPPPSEEV